MFKKMTFLECLQKNQKVINSCITVEQAERSRHYTRLINRRWGQMDNVYIEAVRWNKLNELAEYTEFMREEKIKSLTKVQEVVTLHIQV